MNDFMQQVERYRDEFYRYVRRTLWDPGLSEDVFSDALLAAWENRHKFQPGTNFRAWMYRILTNKCYVANRNTGRTPHPIDEVPESSFVRLDTEWGYRDVLEDPDHVLQQCDGEIHDAFQRLSPSQRSCLLLRSVERFSYKEIAEILEMPVGTVMTHLSRGRAKLRSDLLLYARQKGLVRQRPRILEVEQPGERDIAAGGGQHG
ncbi:MAG: RNA polymerase sigma factor [Candidatus Hydrogenedentes bacterium]|nr:RNA polymerase sigma factor [Candidatus Hydrogenedentota bacterium]